ncbi:alpha/beta hydrolase [Streptomyces diastatochromogenes]|nr:alpha/beta hydrolase [Streptomyces diastatochromogenes]
MPARDPEQPLRLTTEGPGHDLDRARPARHGLASAPVPGSAPPVVDADGVRHFDGLTYARTPGYRPRLLDVHVPATEGAVAAVVWIHGGGWLEGDRRYPPPTVPVELLHGAVLGAGLALVCVDYRHSLEAPFPAQLHDVKAAIRYVRRHAGLFGVDPERIGAWGESAGGHLAALAGLVRADTDGAALEGGTAYRTRTAACGRWSTGTASRRSSRCWRSSPCPVPGGPRTPTPWRPCSAEERRAGGNGPASRVR